MATIATLPGASASVTKKTPFLNFPTVTSEECLFTVNEGLPSNDVLWHIYMLLSAVEDIMQAAIETPEESGDFLWGACQLVKTSRALLEACHV
jgi:hypothetical protein